MSSIFVVPRYVNNVIKQKEKGKKEKVYASKFPCMMQELLSLWGLPFSTYAPRGGGGVQVSYTFPLRITCKKGGGGPDSM